MPRPAESTLSLLDRARSGDERALADLIARYLPRMRQWSRGRLAAAARHLLDTEDIVQETMIKAVRNLSAFDARSEGAFQAYLHSALRNRLADAHRQSRARMTDTAIDSGVPAPDPSPYEQVIGVEAGERYEAALSRLRPEDRQAIVLRIELCYSYDEIARMLNKSSAAVARVAVSRALTRLSREMGR
jgi:RNA polymerase sigma-70 factor (ECF subfamily)